MIAGLSRFVEVLRREGLAASPAEWLDAVRALELIGFDERTSVREALRCTLVKRADHRPVFERAFDRFFAAPPRAPGRPTKHKKTGSGRGIKQGAHAQQRVRREPVEGRNPTRVQGQPVSEPIEGRPRLKPLEGRPRREPVEGRQRLVLDREPELRGPEAERPHPLRRRLDRKLTAEEERELAAWVPRLIEQIRLRRGRRLRKAARGRLYLRRVFRENLARGGVPFVLPRRRVQPRRSKITLLIDVSWSTATAAGLFLSVAGEFLRRRRETRVLLFVDRAIDATAEIRSWLARPGRPSSFGGVLDSLDGLNLDAPSDYGRAIHSLLRSRMRPTGRDAVLLVLGDGRTNRFDPQSWAFEELAERCGAVLWLVPESHALWGTGDSALTDYLGHVDVAVEARNLAGLARGVRELLRQL
jgi:uncharacterized protein with von Willebrand factor type A (vWA) domain